MNSSSITASQAGLSIRHQLRIRLTEAKYEVIRTSRSPGFFIPSLILPLMFFVLFGIVLQKTDGGMEGTRYLLVSYGAFGMLGASLSSLAAAVAVERDRGLHLLKRAMPLPVGAYLGAKLLTAMLITAVMTICLMLTAALVAHVSLAPWQWVTLLLANVLGVLPFASIGLYIGSRVSGSAAPGVVNLIYLPMSFLSGLWIPLQILPPPVRSFAHLLPAYHFVQLPLAVIGASDGNRPASHLLVLTAFALVFFVLARQRLGAGILAAPEALFKSRKGQL